MMINQWNSIELYIEKECFINIDFTKMDCREYRLGFGKLLYKYYIVAQ